MKFISISILLACLFAATFSNWLIIASFNANQKYIAQNLCVNRNNPNSHCNGHCFLCKQLNQNQKSDAANGNSGKEKFDVQLFFAQSSAGYSSTFSSLTIFNITSQQFSPQQFSKTFFHPPCA